MSCKKDNIFSIVLPGSDLVFTRYLYLKDEVRIALLVSLLNKSDDSLFWAFELYYSGFINELFILIGTIYYDFFYTLNPSFEQFIVKKYNEAKAKLDEAAVYSLIQNLLYRPFNTDVFMLKNICKSFEIEMNYAVGTNKITNSMNLKNNFQHWIKTNDYRSIANWILNENKTFPVLYIYEITLEVFEENGLILCKSKLLKEFNKLSIINEKNLLVAKIMALFSKKEKLKKGRSIYVPVTKDEIFKYKTLNTEKGYKILETACICGINDFQYLSLFKLKRNKYNLKEKYRLNWLYHASFSPIWSQRIHSFGGYPDYIKQSVIFKENPDDSIMQQFYKLYGYEPDEQSKETQEKSIIEVIKTKNWSSFFEKFRKNGLVEIYEEELEELDEEGLAF
jgi:hypothetical protein